jgi:hypothetical protein
MPAGVPAHLLVMVAPQEMVNFKFKMKQKPHSNFAIFHRRKC